MTQSCSCGLAFVLTTSFLSLAISNSEPDSVRDYIAVREMMGKGTIPQAASFCEQLIDKYPSYISLYDAYAEISQYNGTLRKASGFLERRCDGSVRSAYSLYGLGGIHMRLKEYESAQSTYEHSIRFGLRDPKIVKGLAYAIGLAKGTARAITHFRILCHRSPDRSDLWYALCLSYWKRNDYLNALDAARRAAIQKPHELDYRIAAAVLPFAAGNHQAKEKTIIGLIDSAKRRHEFETLGLLRSILVRAYIQDQRVPEAHLQTRLLLTEMSTVGNLKWLGWSHLTLSEVEFMEADFVASLENAKKAIESAKKCGDQELEWESYNREFDCYMELGFYREAICNSQMRLARWKETLGHESAKALADNARAFMEIGEYEVALEYAIRAVISLEGNTVDTSVAAGVHSTLGQIYMGLCQYEEAMNQFAIEERIISGPLFSFRDMAVLRGNQGNCYLAEGFIDKAGWAFREQLGLVRKTRYPRERAYALLNLGNYWHAKGDYRKAREECLLALKEGERLSLRRVIAQAAHSLAALSEKLGTDQETIEWLKRAIGEWQKTNWLAKTGLLGTRGASSVAGNLESLLTLLSRANRKEEAFNVTEAWNSSNGLLFPERNRTSDRSHLATAPFEGSQIQANSYNESRSQDEAKDPDMAASAIPAIDELARLASCKNDLDEESENDKTCYGRGDPIPPKGLEEIRRDDLSDGESAIITFFFGERNSYLILATRDTLAMVGLTTTKSQIRSLVKRVGSYIDSSPIESAIVLGKPCFNRAIADSLYMILISPVENMLASMRRLLIVRGRELEGLPFEMLPCSSTSGALLDNSIPNFLVEKFEVSYRYAAGLPRRAKSTGGAAFPFLIAIGPDVPSRSDARTTRTTLLSTDFPKRHLNEISSQVNAELKWLKSEFGPLALVLVDTEATRERLFFFAEGSAIVHIASHTRMARDARESGSILLSFGGKYGLTDSLRVHDVLRMKTAAQLVVLSSCRTALQPECYSRTDYAKSFLIAGAASVLASLWDVDDSCTEKLMISFYKHLRGGVRKSRALQAAKQELIEQGMENPYYWAAFILVGDDDRIHFPAGGTDNELLSWNHLIFLLAFIAMGFLFFSRSFPFSASSRFSQR